MKMFKSRPHRRHRHHPGRIAMIMGLALVPAFVLARKLTKGSIG
jgi:hypothetical protein